MPKPYMGAMPQEMQAALLTADEVADELEAKLWWEEVRKKTNPDYKEVPFKAQPKKVAKSNKSGKPNSSVKNRFGFWVEGKNWLSKDEYKGLHLKTKAEKKVWEASKAKWQSYCLSDKSSFVAAAKSVQKHKDGVPAAISLAQFIIEGAWGTSKFAAQHNYHGMKGGCTGEGCVKSENGYMAFKSIWYGFYRYAKNVNDWYAANRTGDSAKEWTECLCSHEHGIGMYDVGPECADEDKPYDVKLQECITQYKLERFNR